MTEENNVPQLSLTDLAGVVQIVDICTKRGAFEGSELAAVGAIRNRIAEFVEFQNKQVQEAPGEVPVEAPKKTEKAKESK